MVAAKPKVVTAKGGGRAFGGSNVVVVAKVRTAVEEMEVAETVKYSSSDESHKR